MQNQTLSLFSEEEKQPVFEYLFVINLPEEINNEIKNLKEDFYRQFGSYLSRRSEPHISVCYFPLLLRHQDRTISFLEKQFLEIAPFRLELDGFQTFNRG